MTDLVVITPSRGRPARLAGLLDAVRATAAGDVEVMVCLDADDPTLDDYRRILPRAPRLVGARRSLVGWTNHAATVLLDRPDPPRWLASLGDDHRPRTPGWDRLLTAAIEDMPGPGIAYGNDLFQGAGLPTAWVVSAELVRAVGWMMLPACEHLYVDRAVLELGRAAGRIAYRPDVVIEHLHPVAGKADWDASYRASNSPERYSGDGRAFEAWRAGQLPVDASAVRALTYAPAGGQA